MKSLTIAVCLFLSSLTTSFAANVNEVEPNDHTRANLVNVGDVISGVVSGKADHDTFKFVPPPSGKFTVSVTASSGYGMSVRVLDAALRSIFAESHPTYGDGGTQTWSTGADYLDYTGATQPGSGPTTFVMPEKTVNTATEIYVPTDFPRNADGSIYLDVVPAINYPTDPYHLATPLPTTQLQPYLITISDAAPANELTIEKDGAYTVALTSGSGTGEIFVNGISQGVFQAGTSANNEYVIGFLKIGDKVRITMNTENAENISQIDDHSWDMVYAQGTISLHGEDPLLYTQVEYDTNYTTGYEAGVVSVVCEVSQVDVDAARDLGFINGAASRQVEVNTLNGQVTTLQGQVLTANATITNDATRIAELERLLANANAQVTDLQGQVVASGASITDLQGQVASGAAQVVTLQGQVTELQTQLAISNSRELVPPVQTCSDEMLNSKYQEGYGHGHAVGEVDGHAAGLAEGRAEAQAAAENSLRTTQANASISKFLVNNASRNTKFELNFALPQNLQLTSGAKNVSVTITNGSGERVVVSGNQTVTLMTNGKLVK